MPTFRPLSSAALILAVLTLGACSKSEPPTLSDDLKADLAKAGGSDITLVGSNGKKTDIISATERTNAPVPAPKAPAKARVTRRQAPTPAPRPAPSPIVTEDEAEAPSPPPASQGRPRAPSPSTQREPAGGWKTPGQIIRNAPFPINPVRPKAAPRHTSH